MIPITPMSLNDIAAITAIERDSHLEPWSKESFLEEMNRPQAAVLVARPPKASQSQAGRELLGSIDLENLVLGYICFWCVADEIQILNITVHTAHRRHGIGRSLLLRALKMGSRYGARSAVLEVRKSNTAAQELYRSFGFEAVGERPNYYGVIKEPAIIMRLDLESRHTWMRPSP